MKFIPTERPKRYVVKVRMPIPSRLPTVEAALPVSGDTGAAIRLDDIARLAGKGESEVHVLIEGQAPC